MGDSSKTRAGELLELLQLGGARLSQEEADAALLSAATRGDVAACRGLIEEVTHRHRNHSRS